MWRRHTQTACRRSPRTAPGMIAGRRWLEHLRFQAPQSCLLAGEGRRKEPRVRFILAAALSRAPHRGPTWPHVCASMLASAGPAHALPGWLERRRLAATGRGAPSGALADDEQQSRRPAGARAGSRHSVSKCPPDLSIEEEIPSIRLTLCAASVTGWIGPKPFRPVCACCEPLP